MRFAANLLTAFFALENSAFVYVLDVIQQLVVDWEFPLAEFAGKIWAVKFIFLFFDFVVFGIPLIFCFVVLLFMMATFNFVVVVVFMTLLSGRYVYNLVCAFQSQGFSMGCALGAIHSL